MRGDCGDHSGRARARVCEEAVTGGGRFHVCSFITRGRNSAIKVKNIKKKKKV